MKTPLYFIPACLQVFLLLLCTWPRTLSAQCSVSGLGLNDGPIQIMKGPKTWRVYYTNDDPSDSDYCTTSIAQSFTNIIDRVYDRQIGTFGFRNHLFSGDGPNINVLIYDIARNWGSFDGNCIFLDAAQVNDGPEVDNRGGMAHEMFHAVQYRYRCDGGDCNGLGTWISEGMARCMDDRHFADHDNITLPFFLWDEVQGTMNSTDESLTELSYRACLWWSYLCEQLGTTTTEPEYGIDFISLFYDQMSSDISGGTKDGVTTTDRAIRSAGGRDMASLWQDYTICNVTREFRAGALPQPQRYVYQDEPPASGGTLAYNDVTRARTGTSLPFVGTGIEAKAWSAKYYELTQEIDECTGIGFRCTANEDVAVSLLGVTPDQRAILLSKTVGRDHGRIFISPPDDPINKVVAVVAGLKEDAMYDYQFGAGPLIPEIVRPNSTRTAHAGAAGRPEVFLTRVYVEGIPELIPAGVGRRSVKGLSADQFTATVDGLDAPVLSASYVGGEYWLLLQAPDRPNGIYTLGLSLCGQASVFSPNSVEYGERVALHSVVIDNSGSMGYPTDAKLEAARRAAKLYIDSVSTNDYIGAATFSGNGGECDEDAVSLVNPVLIPADAAARTDYRNAIDGVTPQNMTSIGDGVYLGYKMIQDTPLPIPASGKFVLLLSDGLQNEDAAWDGTHCVYGGLHVQNTITNSDVVVNTIAFGPDSDQALMQQIATETDGDYTYIDVSDSGDALRSPLTSGLTLSDPLDLRLTEGYMTQLERARELGRLFFATGTTGSTPDMFIDLTEEDVEEGLLYVFWQDTGKPPLVHVFDPTGHEIDASDAVIYTDDHHMTFHFRNEMPAGVYQVSLETLGDAAYFVGLAGRLRNRVRLDLQLSQVRMGTGQNEMSARERFCPGVPITILAVLTDKGGALPGAEVAVHVTLPDGTVACGPTHLLDDGAHEDGEAGDGIYGAVFTQTRQASTTGVDRDFGFGGPAGQRGSYRVEVLAGGSSHSGDRFLRQANTSFQVYSENPSGLTDSDNDGMGDCFEVYYRLSPFKADDGELDPDHDFLTNREEFEQGTHPFDADTDGGGESDWSEVASGRCPFDPADDLLPLLTDVELITDTGCVPPETLLLPLANLIRYPTHPTYQTMRLYRSLAPDLNTAVMVDEINLNVVADTHYHDANLVDGTTYYYWLKATGLGGAETPFSRMLTGTAKKDPFPPKGWLVLNHNAPITDDKDLIAWIDLSSNPVEYRLSNEPLRNSAEPWQPITGEYVMHRIDTSGGAGPRTVHHQLRDADGNVSIEHRATIIFDPAGDFDEDGLANAADPDDDNDGLGDLDELFNAAYYTNPYDPDTDRDGLSDGAEVEKGLDPDDPDSDQDDLVDLAELDGGSDPLAADTDGDGIPDGFEVLTGLDPRDEADAREDGDGDGADAGEEYVAGTDRMDAGSVMALATALDPLGGVEIRWPAAPGRLYRVYGTTDFVTWDQVAGPLLGEQGRPVMTWHQAIVGPGVEVGPPSPGSEVIIWPDLNGNAEATRFYQVRVDY